jgi:beta-RFAP synthase
VLAGRPAPDAVALAPAIQRGQRSAVGTYGFASGGLIVEGGKEPSQAISPLLLRVDLPPEWRWVLVRPVDEMPGLAGETESQAFADMPPVPDEVAAALRAEAFERLAPAAKEGRFDDFSTSLFRFGHLAGSCFAARQAGAYASKRLAVLVELIRRLGVAGVGQSSWGPTLFALTRDEAEADRLAAELVARHPPESLDIVTTATCRRGATIRVVDAG